MGTARDWREGCVMRTAMRTAALTIVALASVGALAFGAMRLVSPDPLETPAPRPGPTASDPTFDRGVERPRSSAPELGSAARPTPEAEPAAGDPSAARETVPASRARSTESAILEKLKQRREADLAMAQDHRRSGKLVRPAARDAGFVGLPAVSPGAASAGRAADAPADDSGAPKRPVAPGYAEIAGVEVGQAAHRAGLRRGDRILEYDGRRVNGRVELEQAWSNPGQPETVTIVIQDGRTGRTETREVPSGALGIVMPPRFEPSN